MHQQGNQDAHDLSSVPLQGQPMSAADALRRMHDDGVTIKTWAESHGFQSSIVYSVLSGRRKCLRGQSHQIAVALGLKV
jgi:gp16 family phage-associated protein